MGLLWDYASTLAVEERDRMKKDGSEPCHKVLKTMGADSSFCTPNLKKRSQIHETGEEERKGPRIGASGWAWKFQKWTLHNPCIFLLFLYYGLPRGQKDSEYWEESV